MEIVVDYPPNFDEIDAALHVRGKHIIFAFGEKIYNPMGDDVGPWLVAHESVHGERQGSDILGWWRRYLEDPDFRLAEEIPAHIAEYDWLKRYAPSRQQRRMAKKVVAQKLASPLYGRLVTPSKAKIILTGKQKY